MSISYFLYFFLFLTSTLFGESRAYVTRNVTVDRSIDQMLLRIERAVKNRNATEFETYFSPRFDSESWFDRYYSELTTSQLDSFVLRRFGHVDARGADFKFKFSESHNVTDRLLLRSFIAWTKRTPKNNYAIQTIRYYGEY